VTQLPPILGRGLALSLPLIFALLLYLLAVQPVLQDYAATRDSIDEMTAVIARSVRIAAELPARRAQLAELRRRAAVSQGFLQGANDALVAAQIQNRIKALVEASHGELKSTQVLPVQEEGKYRRVAVRAQMTVDLAAAQRVLYGLETSSPLLFLDNLDLRAQTGGRRQDRGNEASALDLRFDVYGFVRGKLAASSVASSNPQALAN
jgi:general secretion pathway protein M